MRDGETSWSSYLIEVFFQQKRQRHLNKLKIDFPFILHSATHPNIITIVIQGVYNIFIRRAYKWKTSNIICYSFE